MKDKDPSQVEDEIVSHFISNVSAQRGAMSAIIRVIHTIVGQAKDDVPMTKSKLIGKAGTFMWKVLEHVLSEKHSSLLLAQCLIDEPEAGTIRGSLYMELDENSKKSNTLNKNCSEQGMVSPPLILQKNCDGS